MAKGRPERSLILDANVLIDFCQSDCRVLALITSHIGQIYVAIPVLREVSALNKKKCAALKIALVEPELEHVLLAGEKRGSLSFEDQLCLLLAKENGWICITNEKPLRRECAKEKVTVIWGLELLAILVEQKGISKSRAASIATMIHNENPLFINKSVLRQFFYRIGVTSQLKT